jgi:hypothetical protein
LRDFLRDLKYVLTWRVNDEYNLGDWQISLRFNTKALKNPRLSWGWSNSSKVFVRKINSITWV